MTTTLYLIGAICTLVTILSYHVDMAKVNEDRRQARQAERERYYKWLRKELE